MTPAWESVAAALAPLPTTADGFYPLAWKRRGVTFMLLSDSSLSNALNSCKPTPLGLASSVHPKKPTRLKALPLGLS